MSSSKTRDPVERAYLRALARCVKGKNGCTLYTGNTVGHMGYGKTYYLNGKDIMVHRVAWMYHKGLIPEGMFVCHSCDNPTCMEITHLFLGSPADNTNDMSRKWRTRTKLTPDDVRFIRCSNLPSRELARRFNLKSHKSVYNIRNAITFKW